MALNPSIYYGAQVQCLTYIFVDLEDRNAVWYLDKYWKFRPNNKFIRCFHQFALRIFSTNLRVWELEKLKCFNFELKMVVVNIITKNGQWPKSPIFFPLMLLVLKIQIGTESGYHLHPWLQGNLLEGTDNKTIIR